MDPHKSTRSDSNSPLLVSEVDIENVLALNSDYIENLINIDNNYLSTLIDSLELLEVIQFEDDSVEPPKRNISDAISYLKQLENSQTQTNDNTEVLTELANDGDKDNDNSRCELEFEDVVQRLKDISEYNEPHDKIVIGETSKDNEVTADDKLGHCKMGSILQYPRKKVIAKDEVNDKNIDVENTNGYNDVLRSTVDIEGDVTSRLAEFAEVMKTLSKDLNGLEIPLSEIPPNEINRNMESNLEVISKKFDSIDYTQEETSNISEPPGIGTSMDIEDMILKHMITQLQPKALIVAKEDTQITVNAESSKIYTSLHSSSEVNKIVDNSATNSPQAKRGRLNEDTNNIIVVFNDRPTTSAEDCKQKINLPIESENYNNDVIKPYRTEYFNSASKGDLMRSSSDEDDDKKSFHSSDFEIITEDEAVLNGLIVNKKLDFSIQDQGSTNSHLRPLERRKVALANISMRQSRKNDQRYEVDDDMPLSNLSRPGYQRYEAFFNQAGPSSQRCVSFDTLNQARPSQRHEPMDTLNQAGPSHQRFVSFDTLNQARPSQTHEPVDTLNEAGPSHQRYDYSDTNQARPSNTRILTRNYQDMINRATNRWIKDNTSVDLDEDFESLDETARASHTMEEGDDYMRLFQEFHVPMPTRFMENKSTHYRTVGGMQIEDNGPGFDDDEANQIYLNMYAEYRPEANRTLDMILDIYPEENADSQRRRRS